jgi:hypothetical protein
MKARKAIEFWAWVLIYGGILMASAGWFLLATSPVLSGSALTAGGVAAAAGAVLIVVRSRMKDSP